MATLTAAAPVILTEAGGAITAGQSGRLHVALITPGWGSSGHYAQPVLEAAAAAKVFPAGTHMYLDHPSQSEMADRPERSVRDLVGVTEADAAWDGAALAAPVKIFEAYRPILADPDLLAAIGLSIRAAGTIAEGEAEGRRGPIVTELTEAMSVDFVTRAGRGGKVLAVLESARVTARAVDAGVSEATVNQVRDAIRAALGDDRWIRDFDAATVYYDDETGEKPRLYRQGYTVTDQGVTLAGAPEPVRAVTTYVPDTPTPVTPTPIPPVLPAGYITPTESKEDTMPEATQVTESDVGRAQLAETVATLQAQLNEQRTHIDEAHAALRAVVTQANKDIAEALIEASTAGFNALERRALLATLPLTEAGQLDRDAMRTAIAEAEAITAQSRGAGRVTGFGAAPDPTPAGGTVTEAAMNAAIAAAFGRTTKEG